MVSENRASFMIVPLFIIALLNEISYQMVIPIMNHVVNLTLPHAHLALLNTMYGLGIAIFTLAIIIGSPIIGFLSDKFGRKSVLLSCIILMFFSAILFLLSLYLKNITYFLIARFLSGLSGASTAIVQAAIADRSVKHTRSVHFSTIGLALTIGLIIGPLLGGFFVKDGAINNTMLSIPFMMTAVISLLNIFLFMILFKSTPAIPHDDKNISSYIPEGNTAKYLWLFFFLEFSWSLYYLTLPSFLGKIFLYDSQHISLFLSTTGISMCFGLLSYRFFSKYFNNMSLTQLFFGIFILSLIMILTTKNLILNWVVIIPITFSVAMSYVAIMGLLSESVRQEHQGTLMGTMLTVMALAWTITGFTTKFLFSYHEILPFILSATGLILGIFLIKEKF